MKNKQIIFPCANKAALIENEVTEPIGKEVLVRLVCSTISSGTERANIIGEVNTSVFSNDTVAVFPRSSGYSSAGIVEMIGSEVTSVKKGDLVAVSWSKHSQFCIVGEDSAHKIKYDDISMSEAALCHIATFPMLAIRKCGLEIGESAIVMGLGVLGMIAVQLLRAGGAYPVIAVDPVESKRKLALENGADYAFDPFAPDFVQNVKDVSNGGVKVAIEVTGSGAALDGVLDCMAEFGRVALLGCTRNSNFTIDYYHKVHGRGVSLIGANTWARPKVESAKGSWTHHDDVMAVLDLIHGGRLSIKGLVAETHTPEECEEVYQRLITDRNFPVVQFDWRNVK